MSDRICHYMSVYLIVGGNQPMEIYVKDTSNWILFRVDPKKMERSAVLDTGERD